jgi:hypothetical protein
MHGGSIRGQCHAHSMQRGQGAERTIPIRCGTEGALGHPGYTGSGPEEGAAAGNGAEVGPAAGAAAPLGAAPGLGVGMTHPATAEGALWSHRVPRLQSQAPGRLGAASASLHRMYAATPGFAACFIGAARSQTASCIVQQRISVCCDDPGVCTQHMAEDPPANLRHRQQFEALSQHGSCVHDGSLRSQTCDEIVYDGEPWSSETGFLPTLQV